MKKTKRKIGLALLSCLLVTNLIQIANASTNSTIQPAPYAVTLPGHQGVVYKQAASNKDTTSTGGYNFCDAISGGGSYAINYQMTNGNNEVRGDYKVLQVTGVEQAFSEWGQQSYVYYLKFMNNNSISGDAYTSGHWNDD